jgi:hypothetical protein
MAALIALETEGLTLTDPATSLRQELSGLRQATGRLYQRKIREPGPEPRKGLSASNRDPCKYP